MINKFKGKWLVVVVVCLVIGGCMGAKAASNDYIATVEEASTSGWIADDETHVWTLMSTSTSASADVYCVYVNADVTGYIGANMKVRLEDDGVVKYFGILSLGSYMDGVTPVYLFGGTDYVLSGAITNFSYSSMRSPFGWPMNEDKWTITFEDSTYITDATVVNGEYKNQGGYSLTVPAGLWKIIYKTRLNGLGYEESYLAATAVLSSSNVTTSSNADNFEETKDKVGASGEVESGKWRGVEGYLSGSMNVDISSEETYYLKYYIDGLVGSSFVAYINNASGNNKTIIRAVWGGL